MHDYPGYSLDASLSDYFTFHQFVYFIINNNNKYSYDKYINGKLGISTLVSDTDNSLQTTGYSDNSLQTIPSRFDWLIPVFFIQTFNFYKRLNYLIIINAMVIVFLYDRYSLRQFNCRIS